MNTTPTTLRNWHPIEEAIIEHVDRYGMTTPAAASAAGVKGMDSIEIAEQRLQALTRRGDLIAQILPVASTAYMLSPSSHERLGRANADRFRKPPSVRLVSERFAFLAFCCLQDRRRTKLTPAELQQRFADLYRHGSAHHYYCTRETDQPRLGFLRIDAGNFGRWDRIVAKVSEDLHDHLRFPLVRSLLAEDAFEVTVITSLSMKAQRIEDVMEERRDVFPVPLRCLALPELVNFIRPAPD